MADYNIDIEAKLSGFEKAEAELNSFLKEKRKVEIDVEVGQNTSQKLVKNIEQSLKNTKINTSKLSENLAESFNIKNPKVINKMKSQMDSMMSSLAKTWDGKNFNFAGANGFYSGLNKLGETVTKNANIMKSKMGIYDDFYSYFKDKKIYVSDEVKSQLGDSAYKDLLKSNVGKFTRDAKKGISIDSIWGEMKGMFPEHFSKDISNQADQILHVIDLVKKARADMNEVIPSNQLSTEQFGFLKNSAYTEVINTSQKMSDALKKNLIQATEESKSHFQLDVDIDAEKIRSDLQNAIQCQKDLILISKLMKNR